MMEPNTRKRCTSTKHADRQQMFGGAATHDTNLDIRAHNRVGPSWHRKTHREGDHTGGRKDLHVVIRRNSQRTRLKGTNPIIWKGPIATVSLAQDHLSCTSPTTAWAMFSTRLPLEELVVLGDSMMSSSMTGATTPPNGWPTANAVSSSKMRVAVRSGNGARSWK